MAGLSVFWGLSLFFPHTLRRACMYQSSCQFGLGSANSPIASETDNQSPPIATLDTNAVAIFLGTEPDANDEEEDDADHYYVGARTLVYQLLHAPTTRFTSPVAVVILAAEGVRETKVEQLRHDGAVIVQVEKLEHSVHIDVPEYHQVFDKLQAFDPAVMPFRKVALLDADTVITRPLDALFQDANSTRFPVNISCTKPLASGLPQLPDSYTLAATPDIPGRAPVFPPDVDHEENRDYFNAGVILSSPSEELFQFYLGILARPELFGHWLPEQDLLNYAHRWDGPMPWTQLNLSWHLIAPTEADFNAGMAILHCKHWQHATDPCHQTSFARRWEMQGYWEGRGNGT
ncbi:nucleotide-diphospho-sugar transferase [Aspergillus floccosus]